MSHPELLELDFFFVKQNGIISVNIYFKMALVFPMSEIRMQINRTF